MTFDDAASINTLPEAGMRVDAPARTPRLRLDTEMPVMAVDGIVGRAAGIVVDPTRRRVSHVIVKPRAPWGLSRLVDASDLILTAGRLRLGMTKDRFWRCEVVDETQFLPLGEGPRLDAGRDIGAVLVQAWPYSDVRGGGWDLPNHNGVRHLHDGHGSETVMRFHVIPQSCAEIRRGTPVLDAHGHDAGSLLALLTDEQFILTGLVMRTGHWWAHREVAIPMGNVGVVRTDLVLLSVGADHVASRPPLTTPTRTRPDTGGVA